MRGSGPISSAEILVKSSPIRFQLELGRGGVESWSGFAFVLDTIVLVSERREVAVISHCEERRPEAGEREGGPGGRSK